jgi:L-alanine-DL-glutamate epimerase-like enolase superfamily enzyme
MAGVAAGRFANWPMLKLKLTGESSSTRIAFARCVAARPDAWIGVDANQGYSRDTLAPLVAVLLEAGSSCSSSRWLAAPKRPRGVARPLPFAADESVCTLAELERAPGGSTRSTSSSTSAAGSPKRWRSRAAAASSASRSWSAT